MKKIVFIVLSLFFLPFTVFASDITMDQVILHNSPDDCWMIFENKVYDITSEVSKHDKYMDIRSWCGKDMTEDFASKAGMGRDHKPSSYQMLDDLYIGDLSSSPTSSNNSSTTDILATDESHDYSVEISGQELKTMTIKEVATLWEIDPDILLQQILSNFGLHNDYSINSTIEEMRAEIPFSPTEIKTIAENNKSGSVETNTKNETMTAKNPYNIIIPVLITISLWIALKLLFRSKLSKSMKFLKPTGYKLLLNSLMVVSLIPTALFGLFMIFQYSFPILRNIGFDILWWHVEGSVVFSVFVIIHIIERLNQVFAQLRSIR